VASVRAVYSPMLRAGKHSIGISRRSSISPTIRPCSASVSRLQQLSRGETGFLFPDHALLCQSQDSGRGSIRMVFQSARAPPTFNDTGEHNLCLHECHYLAIAARLP
jgi:hypothetical protein